MQRNNFIIVLLVFLIVGGGAIAVKILSTSDTLKNITNSTNMTVNENSTGNDTNKTTYNNTTTNNENEGTRHVEENGQRVYLAN